MINRIISIQKNKKLRVTLTLLFLGIVFSYGLHLFGDIGRVFLPMHIFVIIGAYILSPICSVTIAVLIPILNSFLTGMPIIYPMLPIIMVELMAYTLVISLLKHKSIYYSLITAMISGRIAATLTVYLLNISFGLKMHPIRYIESSIITGLPGIIFQIIIIPIIITLINNQSSPWSDFHGHN